MDPRPPAFNLDPSQRMYTDPTNVNNIQWPSNFQFTRPLFDSNRLWNNPPMYQHPTPPPMHEQYTPVEVQYPNTTQTSHPSPTPRSNSTFTAPGGRPPNWTHLEDVALCKAWINVSTDAVVGTGLRKQTFWDRIHAEYIKQMPGTVRVAKECEKRWGTIYPEVLKWSASLAMMQGNVPSWFNQLDEPYRTPVSGTPPSVDTPNDSSPLDNGFRGSSERPIGRNAAKKQRQGNQVANSDSSSVVGDKIAASIATIKEGSQERWDKFKERHEEESFYKINIKKLKLITQRAVIEESIIRSEKELISIRPTALGTEAEIDQMVMDRKRKLAELEAEAEAVRSMTYSPRGTSRSATMDHGIAHAACNLTSRFDE